MAKIIIEHAHLYDKSSLLKASETSRELRRPHAQLPP